MLKKDDLKKRVNCFEKRQTCFPRKEFKSFIRIHLRWNGSIVNLMIGKHIQLNLLRKICNAITRSENWSNTVKTELTITSVLTSGTKLFGNLSVNRITQLPLFKSHFKVSGFKSLCHLVFYEFETLSDCAVLFSKSYESTRCLKYCFFSSCNEWFKR
jgi:hypothetical protein